MSDAKIVDKNTDIKQIKARITIDFMSVGNGEKYLYKDGNLIDYQLCIDLVSSIVDKVKNVHL